MQTREELLELVPYKRGVVLELVVENGYRGKGIGTLLMEKIESYFKQKGCSVSARAGLMYFLPTRMLVICTESLVILIGTFG